MISPDSHVNVKELQRLLKDVSTAKITTHLKDDGPDLSYYNPILRNTFGVERLVNRFPLLHVKLFCLSIMHLLLM